jgi:hypothetical protein
VELCEPDCLSEVRALTYNIASANASPRPRHTPIHTANLEEQPLLGEVRVCASRGKAQLVLCVVLLNEVLDDGAGFPQGEVGVGVVDGGHAAVGVDLEELGLFEVGELDVVELVGEAELLAHHADLGRVGAVLAVDGDGLDGGRHGGLCGWWLLDGVG